MKNQENQDFWWFSRYFVINIDKSQKIMVLSYKTRRNVFCAYNFSCFCSYNCCFLFQMLHKSKGAHFPWGRIHLYHFSSLKTYFCKNQASRIKPGTSFNHRWLIGHIGSTEWSLHGSPRKPDHFFSIEPS